MRRPNEETILGDYIDNWLIDQAMTVTGIPAEDVAKEDRLSFTYPQREGGFDFIRLMDHVHGAYVGFSLEALYPEGLTDESNYEAKGGLREITSIVKLYLPHHDHNDPMKRFMEKSKAPRGWYHS